jgi:hypothetical protein
MFANKSLRALLLTLSASSASCSHPSCQVPVLPASPPPTVQVTPARPPCNLPPLPHPVTFGGVPDGDNVVVTKTGLAELAGYLVATRAWIGAASTCLGASQ